MFLDSGQVCSGGTRLVVEESIHDEVVTELVRRARNIRLGGPFDDAAETGPLISKAHREKVHGYVQTAVEEGATLLVGGEIPGGELEKGYYSPPTILDGCHTSMRCVQEESFGPVLTVETFTGATEEEKETNALAIANDTVYGLAGAVWSENAGRADWRLDPLIHMPAALMFPSSNPMYDWAYKSEPEPHMNNRRIAHACGKVLGGSSSINGMIFQRGNPLEYDRWAQETGSEQWDYAHTLPYFKRMENSVPGPNAWRGSAGPLKMSKGPASTPLVQAFFEAAQQAGYPMTDDVNGYRQEGFAPFDANHVDGHRQSASRSYLWPVRGRKNLTIETMSSVVGLRMQGNRATGVNYLRFGKQKKAASTGKVILCGGAFNSPQLLQLVGIGGSQTLAAAGVRTHVELPGVGENMQDHLEVYLQHKAAQPVSIGPWLNYWLAPLIGAQWLLATGVGTSSHFEGGGFIRTNDTVTHPNLQFHFLPIAVRYDGSGEKGGHGYQVHIGPMNSDVRGSLKIRTTDPFQHPELRFNYLSTENDRREWIEVVRAARDILDQPAMRIFDAGETSPGPDVQSDEEILEWVRNDAETALHPSCTCAMGRDEMSVVDPETMAVHGTEGLHVVDASVMPSITNGNIYAPTMMLAEVASDLIAGNTMLAPERPPFYHHGSGTPLYPQGDPRNNAWDAKESSPSAAEVHQRLQAQQQGSGQ